MEQQGTTLPVAPRRVRYIKLGEGGAWERECIDKGRIRIGFDTANPETFRMCSEGRWDELKKKWLTEEKNEGTATRFTNEVRIFYEDEGSILWVTFVGERLYWGMVDESAAAPHESGHGSWRTISGGWRCTDLNGEELTKERLSGSLTKLAAYRGTTCDVDVADYVVRRVNGLKTPEVERALSAMEELKGATLGLMRLLGWKDFELLVDLAFSTSGWRRLGVVGKTQKTLDLDLALPSTGERAFVQIKAKAGQSELDDYLARFRELEIFDRMFFVHHTGQVVCDDPRVTVVGPERLSDMVIEAGLTGWLIRKVS